MHSEPSLTHIALGLGSNMGPGPEILHAAARALARNGVSELRLSPLYQTSPVGPDQPDYTNACARGCTALDPRALLAVCKRLEQEFGRSPGGVRWGPRPLDIDILIFGRAIVQEPDLSIPHPEMGNRLFVLIPLLDVAADMLLPAGGTVRQFAETRLASLAPTDQKIRKIIEL